MTVEHSALVTDPRLSDPQAARHVADLLAARNGWPTPPQIGVEATRRRTARERTPDDVEVVTDDVLVPGGDGPRSARWYLPTRGVITTSVLFLHGGGWALGDLEMNDAMARELARLSRCAILSLDYRLAPEYPYPAALQDTLCALRWLATESVEHAGRSRLVIAGHSAGGNLAAVAAQLTRDGQVPPLDAQVLLCPVLDCDVDRDSYYRYGEDLLLTRDEMIWYWDMYHPDHDGRDRPELSPIRTSSAAGLPPTTIVVAGADPLRDESFDYANLLVSAGVPTDVHCAEGVPHLFLTFPSMPVRDHALAVAARGLAGAR
ncbi:MAG: alpha/beta hydrolase [Gordonia sp. (in: high G+C Gram-positive bacteria)]